MSTDIKRAKILFIDDEGATVSQFMAHLRDEGFTNVVHQDNVRLLSEVIAIQADLIFLDITGVATTLDVEDEGLAVLSYIKKHAPWTAVVVLSGAEFAAPKAAALGQADQCVSKASLSLADLVNLTEEQLSRTLSPECREVEVCSTWEGRIDELALSFMNKWKLRSLIAKAKKHEGDSNFDWRSFSSKMQRVLGTASNVASIAALFVG